METIYSSVMQSIAPVAQQLVIAYPLDDDVQEVIGSLYYLPERYTLVIERGQADLSGVIDDELSHRVRFAEDQVEGALDIVPFNFADVTIKDGKISAVDGDLSGDLKAHTAEAYASAILDVARPNED